MMKKLISLLSVISISSISSSKIVSCQSIREWINSKFQNELSIGANEKAGETLESTLVSDFNKVDESIVLETIKDNIASGNIVVSANETWANGRILNITNSNVATTKLEAGGTFMAAITLKNDIGKVDKGTYRSGVYIISKLDLSEINISNFEINTGENIYNSIRTQLGSLVGVSASLIESDGVGIGIYQGTNSEPLAQDAVATVIGEQYTIKLVANDSEYFTGDEKDINIDVSKVNLSN